MSNLKKVPKCNTEDAERDFWATHDATDYLDFSQAEEAVFPNLKPSTKAISLRLSEKLATLKTEGEVRPQFVAKYNHLIYIAYHFCLTG